LVASLNRPGGNITGFSAMNVELVPKRLGLLHELVPAAVRFAVLHNPNLTTNADVMLADVRAAAATIAAQVEAPTTTASARFPVHSITSSAMASSPGGTSRPNALAVRRQPRTRAGIGGGAGWHETRRDPHSPASRMAALLCPQAPRRRSAAT
jgi:hypothetical protein